VPTLALDFFTDLSVFAVDWLPVIIAVAFLMALMMWFLAWASRYFEYLKMLESPVFDKETFDFIHKVLQAIWVSCMALLILVVLSFRVVEIKTALSVFFGRMPALFFVIFVIFIAAIIVRALHRFASYLRGDLKVKPRRIAPPRALAFTEMVLKYVIYTIAGVVAFIGSIGSLPSEDQPYKDLVFAYIRVPEPAVVLGFVVALLGIFVASRFVDSLFEDMKKRSTKFTPRVIEELKSTARYAVYIIGAVIIFILAVSLLLRGEQLLVFVVAVIFIALVAVLTGFEAMKNGLAGVTLMLANPFDVGDRVRMGDSEESKVESMGLMMTQVRTLGGELMSIPNTEMLKKEILNLTRSASGVLIIKVSMDFSAPYRKVQAALLDAAQKTVGIEQKPIPQILSKDVRGHTIVYQLTAYTKDVLRAGEIKSELIANIQEVFYREGINPVVSE
jgi:small-conductance mechanosensitive channel